MTVNLSLVLCLDSFLRSRNTHDHEATAMMKAQFMSLWDGEFYTIFPLIKASSNRSRTSFAEHTSFDKDLSV